MAPPYPWVYAGLRGVYAGPARGHFRKGAKNEEYPVVPPSPARYQISTWVYADHARAIYADPCAASTRTLRIWKRRHF